jgi:hypothetical protein
MKTKVSNLTSKRSGREVSNQFEIQTSEGRFFQSYDSIIVFIPADRSPIQLDECYWNYSKTTSKYRNEFLRETTKETQAKIDSGVYKLVNLNQ